VSRHPVDLPAATANNDSRHSPGAAPPDGTTEVNAFFRQLVDHEAFDLHLKVGQPPRMRVRGRFQSLADQSLSQADMERLTLPLLTDRQRSILAEKGSVRFTHVLGGEGCRFRVNLFRQRGNLSLVAWRIGAVPLLEQLGLPDSIARLCNLSAGLILFAGRPGSGKKTTIAAMLDHINEHKALHILTIEDPIAFTLSDKKASVHQREVGSDAGDRHEALDDALHQSADVLFVGELSDARTVEVALHAAESGKLVFAAINSFDAASTIKYLLELLGPEKRDPIRKALAHNLKAIIAQKLAPGLKQPRVPAAEILIVNPTVRKLLEEGAEEKLPQAIRIFYLEGMCDFTESLRQLSARGDIDKATALEFAPEPERLKMAFKGIKVSAPGILAPPAAPAPPPLAAAPTQASTPARQESPPTVRRRATVRYFTRMYPNQLYRLLVVLSRQEVRKLVQHEVEQAASESFAVRLREPIEVEPLIPGCMVYPPRREVSISGDDPVEARFQVMAHIQGGAIEEPVVVIRQAGRELARVALKVRVGKPTLAYGLAAASVVLPVLLKYLKLDLDAQAGDNFSGYLSLLGAIPALPWWMWTAPLLLAAAVVAWWCWPREDGFWNVELDAPEKVVRRGRVDDSPLPCTRGA
jgi:twitching motility protein PilT